ncbi:trigger factor [Anaerorhabdus furcosa]|uniref:Trigger factor n=1 Tax=Anaerorhabdus furcosa TaxID=118967 RepID=A0A1T4PIM6_9FIRM|nr:trigger factor [Anaerorhabdus furcosa]SJZ91430.1 trigger factor [Anaerorhabdus furcosa]
MSTWNIIEKSKGELKVTIEGQAWKDAQVKAFDKLAKNVEIPGFRKGHAPKNMIEKSVSQNNVMIEAIESVANQLLQEGIKEYDLWPVARPELAIDDMNEDKADIRFIIVVKPEVTLGEYKGLPYAEDASEVADDEVNAELAKLQENYADMITKEGAVENGDTAVIDFEGFKDDIAFEGGKAEGHHLVIGSGSFIPGFEEQLIGAVAGDEKDINVVFPENYHAEELKGAPVVFKVKVNEVKSKQLPELNDEFAKDVNAPNVETLEDLKNLIKKDLGENKKTEVENKAMNDLITKVVEGATVDIPQEMIEDETNQLVNDFANRLQQQGFALDQFMQMTGQTIEQIREQMGKDAENKVKLRLVLEAIAKAEKIEVSDDEVEKEYQAIADQYKMEIAKVKELISTLSLSEDIRIRKAYDLIKDTATK